MKPLSFEKLRTVPLKDRTAKADEDDFGAPFLAGGSFDDFLCSLPSLGAARSLIDLRDAIARAYRKKYPVMLGIGGHVIDMGLGPHIIHLMEKKIISSVCLTGAACLQDVEIALSGHTISYADKDIQDGIYGVTEESGHLINDAINMGATEGWGMGNAIGRKLLDTEGTAHLDQSIIAAASRFGIPLTIHPAIGADTFNLHPASHGESLGACGFTDFRLLCNLFTKASNGVVLNVASSVLLPRLFLQALEAARNVGNDVKGITAVVVDTAARVSTIDDVVNRLSSPKGLGILIPGPDEIILPLVFAAVSNALGKELS